MSYELVVRSRAKADIRRAAKWYEKQREGLGIAFVDEVDIAIRRIEANPEQFQLSTKTSDTPSRVDSRTGCYRIQKTRVVVSAVVHLERSDVHWKGKSDKPEEPG